MSSPRAWSTTVFTGSGSRSSSRSAHQVPVLERDATPALSPGGRSPTPPRFRSESSRRILPGKPMPEPDLAHRLAVARKDVPADAVLKGGRVLSVFTGELLDADVAIA